MSRFKKKPVEVEAWKVSDLLRAAQRNWPGLPQPIKDAYEAGDVFFGSGFIQVRTLEGLMEGPRGHWIIQGVKGELYPCAPDIFEATYDPLEPELPMSPADGR